MTTVSATKFSPKDIASSYRWWWTTTRSPTQTTISSTDINTGTEHSTNKIMPLPTPLPLRSPQSNLTVEPGKRYLLYLWGTGGATVPANTKPDYVYIYDGSTITLIAGKIIASGGNLTLYSKPCDFRQAYLIMGPNTTDFCSTGNVGSCKGPICQDGALCKNHPVSSCYMPSSREYYGNGQALKPWQIGLIVAGSVAGFIILVLVVWALFRGRKRRRRR